MCTEPDTAKIQLQSDKRCSACIGLPPYKWRSVSLSLRCVSPQYNSKAMIASWISVELESGQIKMDIYMLSENAMFRWVKVSEW